MTNTPTAGPPASKTAARAKQGWWRPTRDHRADTEGDTGEIERTSWWAVALAWLADLDWDLDD